MTSPMLSKSDAERLAEIRRGFDGRTFYEGRLERPDEFLSRLLDEQAAELERVTAARQHDKEQYLELRKVLVAERDAAIEELRAWKSMDDGRLEVTNRERAERDALQKALAAAPASPAYDEPVTKEWDDAYIHWYDTIRAPLVKS